MSQKKITEHFESEAKEFDEIIIKLIPYYEQMLQALIDAIPFDKHASIRVIDLGCGTGTIAKRIAEKYKNSHIVCLDIAANMIAMAKQKLSFHQHCEFIVGDFSKISFNTKFDVVISSLAIHHIETDKAKIELYQKIYDCLNDTGVFFNADVVLASTDYLQKIYLERWIEYMNKRVSLDEIMNHWMQVYETEDSPSKLSDQLKWLENIGFRSVELIWKYYNFGVYGGVK